ncbi:MAG TPA: CHASE domain-containing protein [Candidatus Limnocylindria bacterium]|nr:CHASE domain-containing protein [Candidatus Limnocylindria bacterium]
MYFINTRKKLTSNTFFLHLLPAGTVLITMLGLTLLGWRNAREAYTAERQKSVNQLVTSTQSGIQDKLDTYKLILVGASGLFVSSNEVTRAEWQKFATGFDTTHDYPGIQGLGYAAHADQGTMPGLVNTALSQGLTDFTVTPPGSRKEYVINLYFEPADVGGLGFDMLSEPKRRSAIMTAKSTGRSAITGKLDLSSSGKKLSGSGFSMFLPVYGNATPQTSADRGIQGYVYAPIAADAFFAQALQHHTTDKYAFRVYDTSPETANLLYETDTFASLDTGTSLKHRVPIELFGRRWILDFRFSPGIVAETAQSRPIGSLLVGTMLSLLLSGFVLTLLVARTRVLGHTKQMEVQSAKDELLSLASHQLRTPATSVKQYLGMVLEGFAGKLSTQQRRLLDKAYESNERQLHIINEILYVAKIDAKGIVLTPRRINLNKLLRELTQEMSATAKKSRQKIRLQMPMRQIYVEADEHCLRMALENLISNALKYSHEGSTANIKLSAGKEEVRITIKDRGVGIDAEDVPLLFQRFSRIPNELSRQTSGSGIGLYLSQQLIKLHSGTIEVSSVKGVGTTFVVHIPKLHRPETMY